MGVLQKGGKEIPLALASPGSATSVKPPPAADEISKIIDNPVALNGDVLRGDTRLTQRWVLAFDLAYRYTRGARVDGRVAAQGGMARLAYRTRSSASFGFAPAVEYNWRSNVGLLLGVRVFTGGHNSATTVTPAIALNYVH